MFYCQVKASGPAGKNQDPNTPRTIKKPTVKVGWYCKNGGRAESTKSWSPKTFEHLSIALLSGYIDFVIGNMIIRMLTGKFSQAAATAATKAAAAYATKRLAEANLCRAVATGNKTLIDAAVTALQNARDAANKAVLEGASKFVNPSRWTKIASFSSRWPRATGGLVEVVAAIGIQLFLEFVLGRINKDFFIEVEIYKLDKKAWKVDS